MSSCVGAVALEIRHYLMRVGGGDDEMLKGFAAPRSPLGTAALVPPPPWYFAGDVLAVEFWNDPDVSVDTLPAGIEFEANCTGHSVALFTDYQFTAQSDEYLDPARYQCRGFNVLLDAMWKGSRIAWCPYSYVDNDAAVLRGWIQGYPGTCWYCSPDAHVCSQESSVGAAHRQQQIRRAYMSSIMASPLARALIGAARKCRSLPRWLS